VADVETTDEWVERIAEAVVRKLDEREHINAIAHLVLRLLEARQTKSAEAPAGAVTPIEPESD